VTAPSRLCLCFSGGLASAAALFLSVWIIQFPDLVRQGWYVWEDGAFWPLKTSTRHALLDLLLNVRQFCWLCSGGSGILCLPGLTGQVRRCAVGVFSIACQHYTLPAALHHAAACCYLPSIPVPNSYQRAASTVCAVHNVCAHCLPYTVAACCLTMQRALVGYDVRGARWCTFCWFCGRWRQDPSVRFQSGNVVNMHAVRCAGVGMR